MSVLKWLNQWTKWASYRNRSNRTWLQCIALAAVLYAPVCLVYSIILSYALKKTVLDIWLSLEAQCIVFFGVFGLDCYMEKLLEPWFFDPFISTNTATAWVWAWWRREIFAGRSVNTHELESLLHQAQLIDQQIEQEASLNLF